MSIDHNVLNSETTTLTVEVPHTNDADATSTSTTPTLNGEELDKDLETQIKSIMIPAANPAHEWSSEYLQPRAVPSAEEDGPIFIIVMVRCCVSLRQKN